MDSTSPLDPAQLARATKKVVDRLAPFCSLRLDSSSTPPLHSGSKPGSAAASPFASPSISPSPSVSNGLHVQVASSSVGHSEGIGPSTASPPIPDASRVVIKIQSKVQALIAAIDAHVKACQIASELSQHSASTTQLHSAKQGLELSKVTEMAFMKVSQDIYKIASHTKDRTEVVLVPPGAGQEPSHRLTLSKVGLDLVANLGLFLQYATMVEQTVTYWTSTVESLEALEVSEDTDAATRVPDDATPVAVVPENEGWQAYDAIVSPLRDEYHILFPLATAPAHLSIEELLQSGEYEFLETEDGYIILSRRIPLVDTKSPQKSGKVLRKLFAGRNLGKGESRAGMRGLLMWDCARGRERSGSSRDDSSKHRLSLRSLSMRRTKHAAPQAE